LIVVAGISIFDFRFSILFAADKFKTAKKAELQRVVEELNQKRSEIEKYRREERSLQRDLLRIEDKRDRSKDRLREIRRDLGGAQGRIGELRQKVDALQTAFGGWQEVLADGLQWVDRTGRLDSPFYGSDALWDRSVVRASLLGQARYLESLQGMQATTRRAEQDMRLRESQLKSRSEKESEEAKRQDHALQEKRSDLQSTQALRDQALDRVRQLEESAQALNSLLASLEKRPRRGGPKVSPAIARHSLAWPVDGKVVVSFGRQEIKELNTWVIRQGISIESPSGAGVRSVAAGRVVYVGPFRRYGRIVIVDHGSGFFSIYGYLDRAVRAKGEDVDVKDLVGFAGPTEEAGPQATGRAVTYFEVRQNGTALDPLAWLEQR